MSKLDALLPLLGWFYISILVYGILSLLPVKIFRWVKLCFAIVCISLLGFVCVQQWNMEIEKNISLTETFRKSVRDKTMDETGSMAPIYYETLRPKLRPQDEVVLVKISTREFLFARMYLYPNSVTQVEAWPTKTENGKTIVVTDGEVPSLPNNARVLLRYDGKKVVRYD